MSVRLLACEVPRSAGQHVSLQGWVHRIRNLGGVRFLVLRDRSGMVQAVLSRDLDLTGIGCEAVVRLMGKVRPEPRAPGGFEVMVQRIELISPAEAPPFEVYRPLAGEHNRLETLLEHRAVSLRMPDVLEVFRVQAEILSAFRECLNGNGFTEITTPKLARAGAEGGSALFEVDYFGGRAYLSQSPQFYKQMMVGSGLERVFEVGHAYRAEKSETARHLTEFVSLDFEMGFIESEREVMEMLGEVMGAIFERLRRRCGDVLKRRGVRLAEFERIPQISFAEAREILARQFGKTEGLRGDLDTEGERLVGRWARDELGSELVFVTGYALENRPAYTMPDPSDPSTSASFDLLYNGIEIATGGQRIHHYGPLVQSLAARGINPAGLAGYLQAFRHGMPPHGGMGMGLERLTKQILGLENVKEAALFPRDRSRLTP